MMPLLASASWMRLEILEVTRPPWPTLPGRLLVTPEIRFSAKKVWLGASWTRKRVV